MQNDTRDRLVKLIQNSVDGCASYWAGLIADELIANGVIVPPCKVGDTAWYISIERYIPLTYKIKEAKVVNFRADCNGIFEFELETEKSTFLLLYEYVYFDKSKAEEKLKELNNNELQRSNRKS